MWLSKARDIEMEAVVNYVAMEMLEVIDHKHEGMLLLNLGSLMQ